MTVSEQEIERIVRQVLAALPGAKSSTISRTGKHEQQPSNGDKNLKQLVIAARVVSLTEVDGQLEGINHLIVARRAVITPAVRDLLRQRRIQVTYQSQPIAAKSKTNLTIGVAETKFDPAELIRALGQDGVASQRLANTGLTTVIDELCEQVAKGGSLGLLLTSETAAAVCLANRQRGVRAVTASNSTEIFAAVRSVGANLLIAQPRGRGAWELRSLVRAFCQGGPRTCSELYAKQLG